jgi:putative ABC transport system permease protein
MPHVFRALALSLRRLAAQPTFAITAVVTLALGIGASTAIYSIAYGVLLRPLPFPDPDRLVVLRQVNGEGRQMRFSRANFADVERDTRSFAGMARYSTGLAAVVGGTDPVRTTTTVASARFFDVIGVAPALGRRFSTSETTDGGPPAAIISHAFWQQHFGARADVVGEVVRIDGESHPIVGVMPEGFDFPMESSVWLSADRLSRREGRTAHNWQAFARLRPDASLAQANQELSSVARALKATFADDTWMSDAVAVPMRATLVGDAPALIALLAGAVAFLLLVSCATVANLLLAQGVLRAQEFAVRQAIGATWGQLLRQLVTEHMVLVALGGAAGVWLAQGAVRGLLALDPGRLPLRHAISVDGTVLSFALALATTLGLLLALTSALRLLSDAPVRSLGAVGRGSIGGRGVERVRRGLVVLQMAFTLVLLVGAGLLGQRLLTLLRADPGFPTTGMLVVSATFPPVTGARAAAGSDVSDVSVRRSDDVRDIVSRLAAIGRVESAGGINAFPLTGSGANGSFLEMLPGDEVSSLDDFIALGKIPGRAGYAEFRLATPGYFETMAIARRQGRLFTEADTPDAPHVAVVNDALARARWPGIDPIGRRIQFGNMDGDLRTLTVVGVVADVRDAGLEGPAAPTVYANAIQRTNAVSTFTFVVRGAADPLSLARDARAVIRAVAPDVPVTTRPVDDLVAATYGPQRFSLIIVLGFAMSALLLAVFGVYGVSSYAVSSRTREFGLRMVLGANRRSILSQVLREGLWLIGAGTVAGVLGAAAVSRLMASLVRDLGTPSPALVAGGVVLLGLCALLACALPARRAASIEPGAALREP